MSPTPIALSAASFCAVLFCWSVTALLCLFGAVVLHSESGRSTAVLERAIGYTTVAAIVFGAGMIVLGVLGWVGSALLAAIPTATATATGGLPL